LTPFAADGCALSLSDQRALCSLLSRQDYPQPFSGITHPVTQSGRSEHAYVAMLATAFLADPKTAPGAAVYAADPYLLSLAERAFQRAGLNVRAEWEEEMMELDDGEIGVWLSDDGGQATFSFGEKKLSEPEAQMMAAWVNLERGEAELILSMQTTRATENLASRYGAKVRYAGAARPVWERALANGYPEQFRIATDGIYFALSAISVLAARETTLQNWAATMPSVHRMTRSVHLDDEMRGKVLRTLAEKEKDIETEGGLWVKRENGWAWIAPDETRPECHIVTEATNAEFAAELCDFFETTLKKAIEESGGKGDARNPST
jgi:hypothetical protein